MKKIYIYFLIFMLIIFLIPIIFTKRFTDAVVEEISSQIEETQQQETNTYEKYDYTKYASIKLYHTENGEIQEIPIDEYLYGVVSAEMPADYEVEALKAQAIVARTYTIYQIMHNNAKHGNADICDNFSCCQAWISKENRIAKWNQELAEGNWNKIVTAVDSTSGKIITYAGNPINAFFHSNSGGKTEAVVNVWGGTNYPYLQSVETSGENGYSQYSSEVTFTKEQLIEKIKEKHSIITINFDENPIEILEYTESGRIKTIRFGNVQLSGVETRTLLGLKSANFTYKIDGDNITFSVIGYGHGVGMSQTGADSMAKNGSNCEEIIKHFYTKVEISEVNGI